MSKSFIILLLLFAKRKTALPPFTFTEKYAKIVVNEGGIEGRWRTMRASVSPDKKKLAISGRIYQNEAKSQLAPISLFDLDSNYQLQNEKKYTPGTLAIANQQLISSDRCIVIERNPSGFGGKIIQIEFTGATGAIIDGTDISTSDIDYLEVSKKISQNLVVLTTWYYPWFYKTDGTQIFPSDTQKKYGSDIFVGHSDSSQITAISSHSLDQDISSNFILISGSNTFVGIVDTSKLSETPPNLDIDSLLFAKRIFYLTPRPNYIEDNYRFSKIEYNQKKLWNFLSC